MPTDLEILPNLLADPEPQDPETNEGPKSGERAPKEDPPAEED